jgi:ABC-2 type transport system ATP-binding protein
MMIAVSTVLEVHDVRKHYRAVKAVDGLSFRVTAGEIVALLGPNGAGKTTTLRMINGIIPPDSGSIALNVEGARGVVRPGIGYLPEDRGLYRDQRPDRILRFFGELRGMTRSDARRGATRWLERFELADRAKEKLEALSKGNQQKVQFAAAVLHRPRLALLDEPFAGLDPVNQDAFLDLLEELRQQGMTILLSAHQMQLVERIADRVLIMNRGQILLDGTLDELRTRSREGHRLVVRSGDPRSIAALVGERAVERVEERDDGTLCVVGAKEASISTLMTLLGSRCAIDDVHAERATLHDIYVRAVKANGSELGTEARP